MKGFQAIWLIPSLILGIITFTEAEPVRTCEPTNGRYVSLLADFDNCSIFYKCDRGNPVQNDCPTGLYFNAELNVCDWPHNVNCNRDLLETYSETFKQDELTTSTLITKTTSASIDGCLNAECPLDISPPANVTFFPHDTSCGRYCMCDWYGSVHDMPCPDGLHWNSKLETCDWPWNAGCENSDTTSNSATDDDTSADTEQTTSESNVPTNAATEVETATTGSTESTSDFNTQTTTAITGSETTSGSNGGCLNANCPWDISPPANVTFFPHDTDCGRYCVCDWYSTVHDMACPDGLHWNSQLDTCDWPWNAGCESTDTTSNSATDDDNSNNTEVTTTESSAATNASTEAGTTNEVVTTTDSLSTTEAAIDTESTSDGNVATNATTESETQTTKLLDPTTDSNAQTTTVAVGTETTSGSNGGCLNANCPWDISPPANVTFFPHDTDCGRYCVCDWYSTVHDMACPDGLHWNSQLDTCDWPWSAGCESTDTTSNPATDNGNSNNTEGTTSESSATTNATTEAGTTTEVVTTTDSLSTTEAAIDTESTSEGNVATNATTESETQTTKLLDPTTDSNAQTTTVAVGTETTSGSNGGCLNANCPWDISPPANVTFFPHDSDCGRYCMCDWYSSVHDMACADGLHWNSQLDTCDWPWNAGCENSDTTSNSATEDITKTDSPTTNEVETEATALPGSTATGWESTTVAAGTDTTLGSDVGCLNTNCPWDISPPANVTFFPHDTDCGRYCMCDWFGIAHDMPCPDGLHWNIDLDTCDWPWDAGCENGIPS